MKTYSGYQYLLIDVANQYGNGLDKLIFEERIQWAEANLSILESLVDQAETKPLYVSAMLAIRKAQAGIPTGHMVGLDATCSGIQIMSALTGCIAGARATGMIDPDVRADAYSEVTKVMGEVLGAPLSISRADAKKSVMHTFYGGKKTPKSLFGEDTPELAAFYEAALTVAPGAWGLLQDLLASWQPYALLHEWKLPDGFDARVKVMEKVKPTPRIEVDELDHATFSYEFYENKGSKTGLSIAANVTHSMDAWLLRGMHRRCNYDRQQAEYVDQCIEMELIQRSLYGDPGEDQVAEFMTPKVAYYIEQYVRSTLVDIVILPYLDQATVTCLSTEHLQKLAGIITSMLKYKPFPLVTVHDEFRASPVNMNHVRSQYRDIMAEIADSDVLDDLLTQLNGYPVNSPKLSFNLAEQIRESAYSLC